MSDADGPFRRDARIERRVSCAPPDDARRVIAEGTGDRELFLGYLVMLALGAAACAWRFPEARVGGGAVALLLLAAAALLGRALRRVSQPTERVDAALPRTCALTSDAMIFEGAFGETAYRYDAIRALQRSGGWIAVAMHGELMFVLRADEPAAEPLESFLRARATALRPRTHRQALLRLTLAWIALNALGLALGAAIDR